MAQSLALATPPPLWPLVRYRRVSLTQLFGNLVRQIDIPSGSVLVPASGFIGSASSAGGEDDDVTRLDIAGGVKGVEGLHNHLLPARVSAGPGELEAFTTTSSAVKDGKAV